MLHIKASRRDRCGRDRMVVDLQLPMQAVPITTDLVSSNLDQGEVYKLQHYVIKLVSDLRQVGGFLRILRLSSTNKTDHHDITEVLLKVAFNTIKQKQKQTKTPHTSSSRRWTLNLPH